MNESDKTAGIIGCTFGIDKIFIPSSISYESKEYLVTSILEYAFNNSKIKSVIFAADSKIQTIEKNAFQRTLINNITIPSQVTKIGENAFCACRQLNKIEIPNDSMLRTIEKNAFYLTSIQSIKIPSKLVELKDGWCNVTAILTQIYVNFYDQLVFCVRNIETANIPGFIEYICPYAFHRCISIKQINFKSDSKLKIIGEFAFSLSSLKEIIIPSNLVELRKCWCFEVNNLNYIKVSPNNSRFCVLDEKFILRKSSIEQENYDQLVFCVRNIKKVSIPSFIEHICTCAFNECDKLQQIEIPKNSKLKTIDSYAFAFSTILNITIPSQVTIIDERAFYCCDQLREIKIPDDSKLQIIGKNALSATLIESFRIPSYLIELSEMVFYESTNLNHINVNPDNLRYCSYDGKFILGKSSIKQENYNQIIFCDRNIKKVLIPSFIEHICSCAFDGCNKLQIVEFPCNSMLKTINEKAFSSTAIKSISIPSQVTFISESAFKYCYELTKINIESDSKLKIIEMNAFNNTKIESIVIPSQVSTINAFIFYSCKKLKIVEIHENSRIEYIDQGVFYDVNIILLMIPAKLDQFINII